MSSSDYCDPNQGSYGYIPSLAAGIAFTVIYGILTVYSLFVSVRQRKWFISFAIGGILETVGWIGRSVAHHHVCNSHMFIMQICCLLIAPALFSAALYILLGILIQKAPKYSALSPRTYIIVFCSIDFLSLLIQAVGGGIASSANTNAESLKGSYIVVGGVFVQLAGMTAFTILGTQFLVKSVRHGVRFDTQVLVAAIFATVLIFIRNIYRAIELLQGWNGHINTTEGYLIGLDGVSMVLCMMLLCYLAILDSRKPGLLERRNAKEFKASTAETGSTAGTTEKPSVETV
ncbi:protein of unknown function [Taphrina deformans PYCC 5710]|uniref:RTA1 domain protein n=1 Tax=Taphrina deformans (strain PYCC 5710 / ATCC 11124 / CBS 356.35 / IMI 108563 / JCM 9778 / NBRC 8474) TaxID=1097556 RepID=R4XG25_TAPDE|nr:protein of unknown function [Taphrina deformans PYCC 5710]|eukprot:CCG84832.1 protein of unknown function [Taphrina deformans PYCC 5710]